MRAVAVVLVLVFHAGFGWMGGGYVGVSLFFTLSGFLITSLLLAEHRQTSRIDVGSFFGRRVRRLLPASLVCLIGVGVAHAAGSFDQVPGLRGEAIAAAANVYNWAQIVGGDSYRATFDAAPALVSPLEHYWSLAIEEQFYLVWPFAIAALLAWSRSRRTTALALIAAFVTSAVIGLVVARSFGADVAYWSSVVRLPELLSGAALAGLLAIRRPPVWIGRLALPALVVVIACAVWFPAASGPAYSGTMFLFALVSTLLIAALQGDSQVRRLLSAPLLVWLGAISYGVYLFHWPIFVWVRQRGGDLTAPSVFLVTVSIVVALAIVSSSLIERPIRQMERPPRLVLPTAALATVGAIALIAVLPLPRGFLEADETALARASAGEVGATGDAGEPPLAFPATASGDTGNAAMATEASPSTSVRTPAPADPSHAGGPVAAGAAVPVSTVGATVATSAPLLTDIELPAAGSRPARILTVGDSTAFYVGQALAQWTLDHPDHSRSDLLWCDGCGLILDGTITSWPADAFVEQSRIVYGEELPQALDRLAPDAVVMMTTMDDLANRRCTADEGILTPFDELYRRRMLESYRRVAETLIRSDTSLVVWVKPPVPIWSGPQPEMRELGRWEVMGQVIDEVVAEHGGRMVSVDANAWMHAAGRADDVTFRPDGTHLSEASAAELVDRWLAPTILTELRAALQS